MAGVGAEWARVDKGEIKRPRIGEGGCARVGQSGLRWIRVR